MPTHKSAAQSGKGSVLSIGTTGTTPTFTVIGEVMSAEFSGNTAKTVDTTSFDSGSFSEFLPVIIDSGTVKLAGNRVSSDAGQIAVLAAFVGLQVLPFTLVLPMTSAQTTSGDSIQFNALIEGNDFSVAVDKQVTFSVSLKVSGPITTVAGA